MASIGDLKKTYASFLYENRQLEGAIYWRAFSSNSVWYENWQFQGVAISWRILTTKKCMINWLTSRWVHKRSIPLPKPFSTNHDCSCETRSPSLNARTALGFCQTRPDTFVFKLINGENLFIQTGVIVPVRVKSVWVCGTITNCGEYASTLVFARPEHAGMKAGFFRFSGHEEPWNPGQEATRKRKGEVKLKP